MDGILSREVNTIHKLSQVANQQEISGPLIGTTFVAHSIADTVAYFGYRHRPVVADRLSFAGWIPNAAGQAYALANTPTIAILGLMHYRKLEKNNESPAQILGARLDKLNKVEAELQTFSR
jgi:hypothetical protein